MRRIRIRAVTSLLILIVAACGDDTAATTAPRPVDVAVTVSGGTVAVAVDGVATSDHVSVPVGSAVHLTVTSDVADEVHLHGYDLMIDVEAGVAGSLDFMASIAGIFEMELEASAFHLIDLEVS